MSTVEAAQVVAYRTIKLPPFGTYIPHLQATFWAICAGKPGSGQAAYPLLVPHGDEFEIEGAWGGYGHDEPGAACQWDGLANTRALVESSVDHPLAKFCAARGAGLYMPASRELMALAANGCSAFNPDRAYASSTQYSRDLACNQDFGYGNAYLNFKSWAGWRARPVRRSSLESLVLE
jgi:hypothetical protein